MRINNSMVHVEQYLCIPQEYSRVDEVCPVLRPPPAPGGRVAVPVACLPDAAGEPAGQQRPIMRRQNMKELTGLFSLKRHVLVRLTLIHMSLI